MIVIVPTCKAEDEVKPLLDEIRSVTPMGISVVPTCTKGSAAQNRNIGLSHAKFGELVIMLDDDITGFFDGWCNLLVSPFKNGSYFPAMVSARLLKPNGSLGHMVGDNYSVYEPIVTVTSRRLPTACIAFQNYGLTFDESYIGSGFEDDDFCKVLSKHLPIRPFLINNNVKLIHKNEMKNQKGSYWEHNKAYYLKKWPDEVSRWK